MRSTTPGGSNSPSRAPQQEVGETDDALGRGGVAQLDPQDDGSVERHREPSPSTSAISLPWRPRSRVRAAASRSSGHRTFAGASSKMRRRGYNRLTASGSGNRLALKVRWQPRVRRSRPLRSREACDGTRVALDAALATVFRGTSEGQAGLKQMSVLSLDQGQLTDTALRRGPIRRIGVRATSGQHRTAP